MECRAANMPPRLSFRLCPALSGRELRVVTQSVGVCFSSQSREITSLARCRCKSVSRPADARAAGHSDLMPPAPSFGHGVRLRRLSICYYPYPLQFLGFSMAKFVGLKILVALVA